MEKMIYNEMPYLDRIVHILMLKSKFIADVGLLNGKLGIVIAFAQLYERTQNEIYYDYMSELLDDVLDHVYKGLDIGFMSGLSGIGWGIEYLLQNRFIEGDGVEICEEIDKRIMVFDPRRITDVSLENGLEGLLHYVLIHLCDKDVTKRALPFDDMYFYDLYTAVKVLCFNSEEASLAQLSAAYIDWYEKKISPAYQLNIMQFVSSSIVKREGLSSLQLGIKEGLSSLLLKQLLA